MSKTASGDVVVITADIINSRVYRPRDRAAIAKGLRDAIRITSRQYRRDIHTPVSFRVTIGDEFQWVIGTPTKAFEVLLFMRSVVADLKIDPMVAFRASIGVGPIAVNTGRSSYEKDGPAFVRSRDGLDFLNSHRSRWTALIIGDGPADQTADALMTLLDSFQQRWTRLQWQAVRLTLTGMKRAEIATRLRVAHQNISKRLIAAEWDVFRVGAESVSQLIEHRNTGQRVR